MLRIVRPVTSVSAEATAGGELGRTVAADTTHAARSTHTADAAWSTHTADTAHATDSTHTADSTYATDAADTAHTTDTANAAATTANVRVPIEIIVVVDVDVTIAPAATPAPAAGPKSPHHDANAKRNRYAGSIVSPRRIVDGGIRIEWGAPNHHGVVGWHIDYLGIGLFDYHHALVLNDSGFHLLLRGGLQSAFVHCLRAHALNGCHDVALLRQERVTKIRRPLNVISQPLHDVWKRRQSLDTRIPELF
jgi:hypothetical protein